jgi:hypothetical protein
MNQIPEDRSRTAAGDYLSSMAFERNGGKPELTGTGEFLLGGVATIGIWNDREERTMASGAALARRFRN